MDACWCDDRTEDVCNMDCRRIKAVRELLAFIRALAESEAYDDLRDTLIEVEAKQLLFLYGDLEK